MGALLASSLAVPAAAQGEAVVDGTGKTITLVSGVQNNPFYAAQECGARTAAAETGATINLQAPAQFDAVQQNQVIEAAAAVAPDGMVVDAVFPTEATPVIQQIIDSGIAVATIQQPLSADGQVFNLVSQQLDMGRLGARTLFDAMGGEGKVFVIDFQAGSPSTDDRLIGFQEVLPEYPGIEFVGNDYAGADSAMAAQIVTGVLQRHPDLAGIWGTNLYGIQGAITALAEAGLSDQVTVVAPDTLPNQIEWLRNGEVHALIGQKPYEFGYQGVMAVLEYLAGEREAANETLFLEDPFLLVTQENMDDPEVSKYFNSFDCAIDGTAEAGESPEAMGSVSGEGRTITLVNAVQNNPYFTSLECGAQKAADETGATLDVQAPAQFDAALQNQVIEAAAARGPDALLVNTVFGIEAAPLVQSIIDAGTPVVVVENLTEVEGEVLSLYMDQVEMGRMAGHVMAEQIGEEGKVWVIDFQAGVKGTDDRLAGFQEAIAEYPGIEFIGNEYTGDDTAQAAQVFSGVLQAHPDLKGVWGTNLYGVQGVITALAEAGKTGDVVVMAPDALPNEVEWLRNGEAYGLLAEKPYEVAYQAVYAALESLAGQREPTDEPVALEDAFILITADNMDDPEVALYFNTDTCPA
jgi:ribose transport system substrate-binding protein